MIKKYKLEIINNPECGSLKKLNGEYVCLKMHNEEADAMSSQFLYREMGKGQDMGGKNMRGNANSLPGLYSDLDGNAYYIKTPNDPKEMFCEMFHGALVNELRLKKYLSVEDPYISGAEGIIVEVGGTKTLALSVSILSNFRELFKYLGTAKSNEKERDNVKEIVNRDIYSKFVEGKLSQKPKDSEVMKKSLARCIFQSVVFFGDYSFHSSNVALYGSDMKVAKIDGGAAFRGFAKNSPVNILLPDEYTGMGSHNIIHKNYIDYYIRIPGLKEYLVCTASEYIEFIKQSEDSISGIILESIRTVKRAYNEVSSRCPFKEVAFCDYFGMDLSIDETLLARQFEQIIYRNIDGFQRIKIDKKRNSKGFRVFKYKSSIYSIQSTILQIILSRGEDVKSKSGVPSEKSKIKNYFMDKFKNQSVIENINFLLYLHLLCAPSRSFSFSSKTADTLASGLSRLRIKDPARIYLGISLDKQEVSSLDLTKSIKKRYEEELESLKKNPGTYHEYLIRSNGNSKVW